MSDSHRPSPHHLAPGLGRSAGRSLTYYMMVEFSLTKSYEIEFRFEMGFVIKFGIELITILDVYPNFILILKYQ